MQEGGLDVPTSHCQRQIPGQGSSPIGMLRPRSAARAAVLIFAATPEAMPAPESAARSIPAFAACRQRLRRAYLHEPAPDETDTARSRHRGYRPACPGCAAGLHLHISVSYTHLTLPTNREV